MARVANGAVATVPKVMATISADRMKSVRMAPLIFDCSAVDTDAAVVAAMDELAPDSACPLKLGPRVRDGVSLPAATGLPLIACPAPCTLADPFRCVSEWIIFSAPS